MAFEGYTESGGGSEQRGPGTFTFNPDGTPNRQQVQAVQARLGYDKAQDIVDKSQPGPSALAALADFGMTIASPKIKEIRDQQFLEGMRRMASGEALQDIVNERPWWSQIFGDSAVEMGARAFATEATASRLMTQVENDMDELRKLDPRELSKTIVTLTKNATLGDAQADTAVMAEMLKQMPQFMKLHTKAHYAWQQEQAALAEFENMESQADSVQSGSSLGSYVTEDDQAQRIDRLIASMVPPPGRNETHHKQSILNLYHSQADKGNFHVLDALDESGMTVALDPKEQIRLREARRRAESYHAREAIEGYREDLDELRLDAGHGRVTGQEVYAKVDAMNAEYKARSGNSRGVIPGDFRSSLAVNAAQAVADINRSMELESLKDAQAAQAAVDKAAARTSLILDLEGRLVLGASADGLRDSHNAEGNKLPSGVVDEAANNVFMRNMSEGRMDLAMNFLAKQGASKAIPGVKRWFNQLLLSTNGEQISDNFIQGYEFFKGFLQYDKTHSTGLGAAAAQMYLGPDAIAQYQAFGSALGYQGVAQEDSQGLRYTDHAHSAFNQSKLTRFKTAGLDDKQVKRLDKIPKQLASSPGFFGKTPGAFTHAYIMSHVDTNAYLKALEYHGSEEAAMAAVVGDLRNNKGMENAGNIVWFDTSSGSTFYNEVKNAGTTEDGEYFAPTEKEYQAALNLYAFAQVKAKYNIEADDLAVSRFDDNLSGTAQLLVEPIMNDGTRYAPFFITAAELVQPIRDTRKRLETQAQDIRETDSGAAITYPRIR